MVFGVPGWLSPVKCPTSAQVMISLFVSSNPASSSVLTAQSLEPASDCLSSPLSAPLMLMLYLSLNNKQMLKKKIMVAGVTIITKSSTN